MDDTGTLVNYAFISYKHKQADGRFVDDEYWAEGLYRRLVMWKIPVGISSDKKLNGNHTIKPVVRDRDSFSPNGELTEKIKWELSQSKCLVLVFSQEMVRDQVERETAGNRAYVFEEVAYFLGLGRPAKAVIVVYINRDGCNPVGFLPDMFAGKEIFVLNINEYVKANDKINEERVAGAVAASIFDGKKELFWDFQQRVIRRNRIRYAVVGVFVFVLLLGAVGYGVLQRGRTDVAESFRLIEYSKNACKGHDRQVAVMYALEAIEKSPDLLEAQLHLRQFAFDDFSEPWTVWPSSNVFVSPDRSKLFAIRDNRVMVYEPDGLGEVGSIPVYEHLWGVFLNDDGSRAALVGSDSLRIYDVDRGDFVFKNRHSRYLGSWSRVSEKWFLFDRSGQYFILSDFQASGDIVILHVETARTDTLRDGGHDLYPLSISGSELSYLYWDSAGSEQIRFFDIETGDRDCLSSPRGLKQQVTVCDKSECVAYVQTDTLYLSDRSGGIFFRKAGEGIRSIEFHKSGDRVVWLSGKNGINVYEYGDSSFRSDRYYGSENVRKIAWGNGGNDVVMLLDNRIMIRDINHLSSTDPYCRELIVPEGLSGSRLSNLFVFDSKIVLAEESGWPGSTLVFHYPKRAVGMEALGDKKLTTEGYLLGMNYHSSGSVQCWDYSKKSMVWERFCDRDRPFISDLFGSSQTHVVLAWNKGFEVVDISSGEVLFGMDNGCFRYFLSDDVIVYSINDGLFVGDVVSGEKIQLGKYYLGRSLGGDEGYFCKARNGHIGVVTDSTHVSVFSLKPFKLLSKIDIQLDSLTTIAVGLSPDGNCLAISQIGIKGGDLFDSRSTLSVWNIPESRALASFELPGFYRSVHVTDNSLFLADFHGVVVYDVLSGELVGRYDIKPDFLNPFSMLPNGNVLLSGDDRGLYEIDSRGLSIVEEKLYAGGGGVRAYVSDRYLQIGGNLIDLKLDRPLFSCEKYDPLSICDSVMIVRRVSGQSSELGVRDVIVPIESERQLIGRMRSLVGGRVLLRSERMCYER